MRLTAAPSLARLGTCAPVSSAALGRTVRLRCRRRQVLGDRPLSRRRSLRASSAAAQATWAITLLQPQFHRGLLLRQKDGWWRAATVGRALQAGQLCRRRQRRRLRHRRERLATAAARRPLPHSSLRLRKRPSFSTCRRRNRPPKPHGLLAAHTRAWGLRRRLLQQEQVQRLRGAHLSAPSRRPGGDGASFGAQYRTTSRATQAETAAAASMAATTAVRRRRVRSSRSGAHQAKKGTALHPRSLAGQRRERRCCARPLRSCAPPEQTRRRRLPRPVQLRRQRHQHQEGPRRAGNGSPPTDHDEGYSDTSMDSAATPRPRCRQCCRLSRHDRLVSQRGGLVCGRCWQTAVEPFLAVV